MKPINDIYQLALEWARTKIKSPVANLLSKGAFYTGALIVSTPLIEHLVFTAILKQAFGIDLGISVPDVNAYIAGCSLISLSLLHNIVFIKITQDFSNKQKLERINLYQDLWERVDTMLDTTARLIHLYCTECRDSDKDYALQAEEAIKATLEYTRKNRLRLSPESLYNEVTTLAQDCSSHTQSFRACIKMKIKDDGSYNFLLAQKTVNSELTKMLERYNQLAPTIRSELAT